LCAPLCAARQPVILNNLEWFGGMRFLEFLRNVGKFARVGTMLTRDAVKSRMEADNEGLSFTE
jgi:tyrosyl-tRNA synthetase